MREDNSGCGDGVRPGRSTFEEDLLGRSSEHVERMALSLDCVPVADPISERNGGGTRAVSTLPNVRELAVNGWAREEQASHAELSLAEAEQMKERLLAAARAEADAVSRALIDAANDAANDIRASAQRDAEDIVSAAHARMKQEREIAEGRAAERLDAAEHEALEIQRNAWKRAQAEIDRRTSSAGSVDVGRTAAESEARGRRERDLLALAIGATRHASRALDTLAQQVASASTDLATTATTLQWLLDQAPEQLTELRAEAS